MSPFWVVLLSNLFSELYINLRGTLRRHFFDRSQRFPKNLPYSRLGQTTPPVSALRLLRRTFLPLAKTVLTPILSPSQNKKPPFWVVSFWLGNRDFPHTTVCYRLANARCPRRRKQFPELFSSESLRLSPSLFESLPILTKQKEEVATFWVTTSSLAGE